MLGILFRYLRTFSDFSSIRNYRALLDGSATGDPAPIRLRTLRGRVVWCRPQTSDVLVVKQLFVDRDTICPPQLRPKRILDLGANIGLTMVYFAVTFPDSVILGVEVDHNNAELCRRNIEGLGDRCRLVEGAVWHLSGEVGYGGKKAWGIRIQAESPNRARAYTMPELLDMLGGADFVKMDIEGAEQEVLRDPRPWSSRIGAIRLEIHGPPYTAEECAETLASCGFQTEIEKGMCEYVTALRL